MCSRRSRQTQFGADDLHRTDGGVDDGLLVDQEADAVGGERGAHLVRRLVVVVAEDGEAARRQRARAARAPRRARPGVRGALHGEEVAGEQHEVGLVRDQVLDLAPQAADRLPRTRGADRRSARCAAVARRAARARGGGSARPARSRPRPARPSPSGTRTISSTRRVDVTTESAATANGTRSSQRSAAERPLEAERARSTPRSGRSASSQSPARHRRR